MAASPHTPPCRLAQLLPETAATPAGNTLISELSAASQQVSPGALFCACAGGQHHGMDFADQAIAQGAAAILGDIDERWSAARIAAYHSPIPVIGVPQLSQRLGEMAGVFFHQPSHQLRVSGITGTNGKTSCAWFVAQLSGVPCAVMGTLGNGFIHQLDPPTHTTPGAIEVQRLLRRQVEQGAAAVAMEVSSHALSQQRVKGVRFRTALFTNLSRDHLDYHGDMDRYAAAKASLFRHPGLAHGVINVDDPWGRRLLDQLPADVEPIGYSCRPPAQTPPQGRMLWASSIARDGMGMRLHLDGSWGTAALTLPLLGGFNVANLLGSMAVLLAQGEALPELAQRAAGLSPVPGRMQTLGGDGRPTLVVDYAHTPDALEQVLAALREHVPGRLICIFGCGGERDQGKRPLMGAIAERLADVVVLTNDNPRQEAPEVILHQILAGMKHPEQAQLEPQRRQAIRLALSQAEEKDVVLLAGKGHESWQQLGDQCLPFDDAAEAKAALARWRPHFSHLAAEVEP